MSKKTAAHERLVEAVSYLTRAHVFVIMAVASLDKACIDAAPERKLADGLVTEARKLLAEAI